MSTPEGAVLKQIMDYLAAKHVLAFRMPVGGAMVTGGYMRFGVKGMSDILAFPKVPLYPYPPDIRVCIRVPRPLWIEVKAAKGVQSEFQKSFQTQVESEGHKYILARSIDDLAGLL
jgi:hypothetical protein